MELQEEDKKVLNNVMIGMLATIFAIGMLMAKLGVYINNKLNDIFITIPEEERVYTQANITRVNVSGYGEDKSYDVYAILKDDEEEIERKLNFYYTGLTKGDTIEVYYRKGDLSYITCKEVEFPRKGPDQSQLNVIFYVSLIGFITTMVIGFVKGIKNSTRKNQEE